jgi:hypothetical protein
MWLTSQRSLTFCLGKFPDRYQRQSCGKSHEQTNCFPLSIWVLHVLLLGTGIDTPDAFSMFARPIALLLNGHALDYESFFFRVNQVLTRRNVLQPIYSHARFFNFRNGSDPNRLAVSKPFKNIKIHFHGTSENEVYFFDAQVQWGTRLATLSTELTGLESTV